MGVKTKISKQDLEQYISLNNLYETTSGVSDTVYIIDEHYVVKVFENSPLEMIENEIEILANLSNLPVSKLHFQKVITVKDKSALLYKKCQGEVLKKVQSKHIKQIGQFLKKLHQTTYKQINSNPKLFTKQNLQELINQANYEPFQRLFDSIDIDLKEDGIIHGDLFIDNALFTEDSLSCVIDFSEACIGDFLFDLGVVALSWCDTKKDIEILLQSYETNCTLEEFYPYIKYARLYYTVARFLSNRDYKQIMEKLSCI